MMQMKVLKVFLHPSFASASKYTLLLYSSFALPTLGGSCNDVGFYFAFFTLYFLFIFLFRTGYGFVQRGLCTGFNLHCTSK